MVKEIKQAKENTVEFGKQLTTVILTLLAVSPTIGGVASVLYGHKHVSGFTGYAVVYSGAIATVAGLVVLYKVLMRHKEN